MFQYIHITTQVVWFAPQLCSVTTCSVVSTKWTMVSPHMSNNCPPTINHTIHFNWQTSQFINPAKLVHSLSVHNDNLPTDENKKCNLHNVKANYIFSSHQLVKVSFLNKTQLVRGQVPRVSRPTRWSWLIFGSVMITDNRETGYSNVLRFPDRTYFGKQVGWGTWLVLDFQHFNNIYILFLGYDSRIL